MSTTTSNLGLFKYNVETDSHLAFNINTALNENWDKIDEFAASGGGKGISRNLGEIISSTIPLTDAGLHLLDGALLQYGSYQAFIDYIADLYDSGDYDDIFETEANWQQSVTDYGVCGKFVYDSTNNTVRLPKITGFTEGTIDPTVLGDLVEAGLPDITGHTVGCDTYPPSGAFQAEGGAQFWGTQQYPYGTILAATFDASRLSSIYGNSTTVQPQAIKVLYYIVIATTTKTDIEVDIDEIATDLNGKADVDFTNVNQTGKNNIMAWGMPDYKNGYAVSNQAINVWYTADKDLMVIAGQANNTYLNILIKDDNGNIIPSGYYGQTGNVVGLSITACNMQAWIPKGYSYMVTSGASTAMSIFAYPLKGAN